MIDTSCKAILSYKKTLVKHFLFQFFGYSSHSLPGLRRAAVPLRGYTLRATCHGSGLACPAVNRIYLNDSKQKQAARNEGQRKPSI